MNKSFRASPNSIFASFKKEDYEGEHRDVGKVKAINEMLVLNPNDNIIAPYLKSIQLIREDCFYLGLVIDNIEVKREICEDIEEFQIGKYKDVLFFTRGRFPINLTNNV